MISDKNKEYWAAVDATEIADNILDKVDDYYKYMSLSGRLDLMRRSWSYYYRPRLTGGMLNPIGQQGELTGLSVNHYRNLLMHLETMTVQQAPNFEPQSTNTDLKSEEQTILANSLLQYYLREKKLARNFKQGVKDCLIFSEGFVRVEWDATGGKTYGQTPTGAPAYEGDLKYTNYTGFNVIRDYTKESASNEDWYILRDFQNKFTLAAKFPEIADKILDDSVDAIDTYRTTLINVLGMEESDNIAVYTLLHRPTPAMKQGRFTTCLNNGTVLMDGPIPYDETHVYRIVPDEETGTIFGYTVGFDLLPIQEALDVLYSTAITNQVTFGVQNVLMPKSGDISTSQLSGGLNVIEYDPKVGKPEALNLTSTPPEVFKFIQQLEQLQETLSGVNSVARGNPEASLKSGAALALVQSMAIQFSMSLQESYKQLIQDIGTGSINILKAFAAVPRVAAIAGKSKRSMMRSFTGSDLSLINRVTVDMGNPMTNTTAGKVNMADSYLEKGFIENPDQYIQVVETGRLEPLIEGKQAQLLLIKGENEGLADGQQQRALITDNHAKHIIEHCVVTANPDLRQDPNSHVVQATLAHIQEHIEMMNNPANQQLMQILHEEIAPGPPPPPQPNPPTQGGPGAGQMLAGTPPVVQQAQGIKPPNMPNPPPGTDQHSAEIIKGQQMHGQQSA